jgi:capsular polysaccharide biosynthesis protein
VTCHDGDRCIGFTRRHPDVDRPLQVGRIYGISILTADSRRPNRHNPTMPTNQGIGASGRDMSGRNNDTYGATLTLADLLRMALARKFVILGIATVCALIAGLAGFLMTPIYQAEVLVAPVTESGAKTGLSALAQQFGGLVGLSSLELSGGNNKFTSIAVLKSRQFTQNFIVENNLLPILFSDRWNSETNTWSVPADEIPTLGEGYRKFNDRVRMVFEDDETGLVRIVIEWKDRILATRWANELVDRANRRMRERTIERARRSIEFLKAEAEKANVVELKTAIYSLLESQINQVMLANVREDYAFEIIDPADVPDEDHFVRPKRLLMVVIGVVIGAFFGMLFAIWRHDANGGANQDN